MIIIRIIVATTMPMAGYFLAEAGEGVFQAFARYEAVGREMRNQALNSPSASSTAKVEALDVLAPKIKHAKSMMARVAFVACGLCVLVCALAIWAGEIVKRLRSQTLREVPLVQLHR